MPSLSIKLFVISDLRLVVCESVNAKPPYYINSVFLRESIVIGMKINILDNSVVQFIRLEFRAVSAQYAFGLLSSRYDRGYQSKKCYPLHRKHCSPLGSVG
jgi:hypothetical protein